IVTQLRDRCWKALWFHRALRLPPGPAPLLLLLRPLFLLLPLGLLLCFPPALACSLPLLLLLFVRPVSTSCLLLLLPPAPPSSFSCCRSSSRAPRLRCDAHSAGMWEVSGFYALVYAVIFLVIDKRDEFQLLQFILQFKGTQFLSHGVIRTIMGFFMFVNCVSSQAQEEQHSCENHGPGTAEFYRGMYEFSIFGWVLQVMLMWAAYFCLRCSIEKGRKELKGRVGSHADPAAHHDEAPMTVGLQQPSNKRISREFRHTGATGPGGYIRYFLLYDAVCFTVVLCGLFIVIALRPEGIGQAYYHWSIRHAFFSAQVVYGYLSMPFFLFMIPVLQRFLTHSIDTAYDTKGRCVAYAGPKRKRDEDEEAKKNRWGSVFDPSNLEQATAGVALNAKLEALYDKVKDIMTNIPKVPSDRLGRRAPDGANADV
ncbi:unnamed protein product, partial [Prorocentrum cordatum]